mgnify:CR=1 FL=1
MAKRASEFGSALPSYDKNECHELAICEVKEHEFGWVFFYNSKRYLETGEFSAALAGNADEPDAEDHRHCGDGGDRAGAALRQRRPGRVGGCFALRARRRRDGRHDRRRIEPSGDQGHGADRRREATGDPDAGHRGHAMTSMAETAETGAKSATGSQLVSLAATRARNTGTDFRPELFENVSVNLSAAERRTP